jgi:hypothetical protein
MVVYYRTMNAQTHGREALFTYIHDTNRWGSPESLSGPGAEMRQTKAIRTGLAQILTAFAISSMLDVPCGDFNWMQHVAGLDGLDRYIGADIVTALVDALRERYESGNRTFSVLDLTTDKLPAVDLIFVRDAMVHMTLADGLAAIANIKRSRATYLMATTYPAVTNNIDTEEAHWRPLNLRLAPFHMPAPLDHVVTDFTDGGKHFPGNGMSLWLVNDL